MCGLGCEAALLVEQTFDECDVAPLMLQRRQPGTKLDRPFMVSGPPVFRFDTVGKEDTAESDRRPVVDLFGEGLLTRFFGANRT